MVGDHLQSRLAVAGRDEVVPPGVVSAVRNPQRHAIVFGNQDAHGSESLGSSSAAASRHVALEHVEHARRRRHVSLVGTCFQALRDGRHLVRVEISGRPFQRVGRSIRPLRVVVSECLGEFLPSVFGQFFQERDR